MPVSVLAAVLTAAPAAHAGVGSWTTGDQPGGRPAALALAGDLALAGTTGGGRGGALLRSADGGATWVRVDAFPHEDVFDVAVHPGGLAFAATRNGLFRSADGGEGWGEVVPTEATPGALWAAVEIDQSRPAHAVAVRFGGEGGGVWRSTTGGETWTRTTGALPAPAAVTDAMIDPVTHTTWGWGPSGVFTLPDGGEAWSPAADGLPAGGASEVVADPRGRRVIALAGPDLLARPATGVAAWAPAERGLPTGFYGTGLHADGAGNAWATNLYDNRLWRLPAGGGTWAPADTGFPGPADLLAADRAGGGRTLAVPRPLNRGEGALWRTVNGGGVWAPSAAGFRAVRVTGVAADPRRTGRLLASTVTEGVQRSADGGRTWEPAGAGLPAAGITDVVADAAPGVFHAGTDGSGVYSSADGGATWAPAAAGAPPDTTALASDPRRPGLVYAADEDRVHRSTDGGAHWTALPLAGLPGPGATVARLVPDPRVPGALVRVGPGGVFHLEEGAAAWTGRNTGLPPGVAANDLAIDPRAPERWVLATDAGVWRSVDGGAGWRRATGIPDEPVTAVAIDPGTGEVVASSGGRMHRSTDGGAGFACEEPAAVLPPVTEFAVDADGRTLYGATAGRGVLARTRATDPTPAGGLLAVATPPRITGRVRVAGVLRVVPATFTGPAAVATRWQRCAASGGRCRDIRGAGRASYRPVLGDVGRRLRVVQTATGASGTTRGVSAATRIVPSPAAVRGAARPGRRLRAVVAATGLRRARVVAIRWQRCAAAGGRCRTIPRAAGWTYRVRAADIGRRLVVVVTVRSGGRRVTVRGLPGRVVRR